MSTTLSLISNFKQSKEDILARKDHYLQALMQATSKWGWQWAYERPFTYDPKTDCIVIDDEVKETISYNSEDASFFISVYESCIELSTILHYADFYKTNPGFDKYQIPRVPKGR